MTRSNRGWRLLCPKLPVMSVYKGVCFNVVPRSSGRSAPAVVVSPKGSSVLAKDETVAWVLGGAKVGRARVFATFSSGLTIPGSRAGIGRNRFPVTPILAVMNRATPSAESLFGDELTVNDDVASEVRGADSDERPAFRSFCTITRSRDRCAPAQLRATTLLEKERMP